MWILTLTSCSNCGRESFACTFDHEPTATEVKVFRRDTGLGGCVILRTFDAQVLGEMTPALENDR